MPTYFQVVKQVLDGLYEDLPTGSRDQSIIVALENLSKKYNTVLERGGPDYGPAEAKFAYIFRYTTAHADFLDGVIRLSDEIKALATRKNLIVSCIGGGPGSDILGFVKYLLPIDPKPHLTFFLLDKDQSWSDAWWNLDVILGSDLRTSSHFIPIDVTNSATWRKNTAYLKADIYTLIYFLSEIFVAREAADKFLRNTLSSMKPGAVLIVLDFQDSRLTEWIEGIAANCHLATKIKDDNAERVIDPVEEKTDLGEYYTKFGTPKIRARIFYRVYVKE
jgi:hypothetical protein